jgi:hypothetical protein
LLGGDSISPSILSFVNVRLTVSMVRQRKSPIKELESLADGRGARLLVAEWKPSEEAVMPANQRIPG